MTVGRYFGRWCRLQVGELDITAGGEPGVPAFRIGFRVSAKLGDGADSASVTVHNLSADTRARLDGRQRSLILQAGYREGEQGAIFVADHVLVSHAKEGPDWITTFDGRDGIQRRGQYHDRSYEPGTTALEVVEDIAQATGVPIRWSPSAQTILSRRTFPAGRAMTGYAGRLMQRLSADLDGVSIRYQRDAWLVIAAGETVPETVPEFGPESGLIGAPALKRDPDRPRLRLVDFTALLSPSVRPGGRCVLLSNTIGGTLKIESVTHSGDTDAGGASWTSAIEGRLL